MPSSARNQEFIERSLNIAASLLALILLAPTMLAIAALVKWASDGPIFSRAPRVGRGGRHFMLLKFRSMHIERTQVTPVGRLLRRYSLDELPQLINVLRGEMSLLGRRRLPAVNPAGDTDGGCGV
jgi:lipopolysaccharide/colanic/teichoic acid biosynthesis glycosyltransferase